MTAQDSDELDYLLLDYQCAWIADRAPIKICEKSRRIGITWATAAEAVIEAAATDKDGGQDVWYLGQNEGAALEFIRDATAWANHINRYASSKKQVVFESNDGDASSLTHVIRFASGHRITALNSRPSNLRGKQGYVIIDEAAFHDDLKQVLKAAIALTMWGGRVAVISTHDGTTNEFHELVESVRKLEKNYSLHRVTLDDALRDGLYARICTMSGQEWSAEGQRTWVSELLTFYGENAAEELDCIPSKSGGVYLPQYLIEDAMHDAPIIRLDMADTFAQRADASRESIVDRWCSESLQPHLATLPKTRQFFFGQDFGRSSDLSVMVPMYLASDMTRTVPFMVELFNVPFQQQEQIAKYICDRLPKLSAIALDATGNGSYQGERLQQKYGQSMCEALHMTALWYSENLPPLKSAFERGLIKIPRDADVMTDLLALRRIDGQPMLPKDKTKKTAVDGKTKTRHGDSAIALALAYYASKNCVRDYDYKQIPRHDTKSRGPIQLGRKTAGGLY